MTGARPGVSRRGFLKGSGLLVVSFSLLGADTLPALAQTASGLTAPALPPAPAPAPTTPIAMDQVDSWIAIGKDSRVTVYSGRVELGTGVRTALAQIAADELDVPFDWVTMVQGQTGRTPDEGYTAGSKTIQVGGVALRKAAAQARQALLELGAAKLNAPIDQLTLQAGAVRAPGGGSATFGDLIGSGRFNVKVADAVRTKAPASYAVVGTDVPRLDLPGKLFGQASYVQDVRLPGMLHGRVVRPLSVGARLESLNEASLAGLPGVVKVVRTSNFVGVVAEREEQAIDAAQRLDVTWQSVQNLHVQDDLYGWVRSQPTDDRVVLSEGDVDAVLNAAPRVLSATYQQPYQLHGSIGPSCAVADVQPNGDVTIYSSTQGVYPLRDAVAGLLGTEKERVRVIHVEGAGCYGHNGFDDAAADAALLSKAVGKPVRVQWMRRDEHAWEPKGPAMVMEVSGAVGPDGQIAGWDYGVWTPTHSTRPGGQPGNLLAGQLIEGIPPARNGATGGDRNAKTNYAFGSQRVTAHWLDTSPLRQSALRSLGAFANGFANESFMDELAAAAGADPVDFRLRHLDDPRAQAVVRAAAEHFGWDARPSPSGDGTRGRGIAFARYENVETYVATIAEVEVNPASGKVSVKRVVVAHDAGLIINPNGITNQVEGQVIQGISRTLKEEVRFSRARVTSVDWQSYPILTFAEVPDSVDVVLINHPDQPAYGVGEPTILTLPGAIGNAIFDATGARLRTTPFTPQRVQTAIAQLAATA